MKNDELKVYLEEIIGQAKMAISATTSLNELTALRNKIIDCQDVSVRRRMISESPNLGYDTFRNLHSFLTHVSNISRLIWPPIISSNKKCYCDKQSAKGGVCGACVGRARSANILKALEIGDADHIIKTRTIRDHLEHFDERLDNWVQTSKHRNYIQDFVGPKDAIRGVDQGDRMRHYDPETADLIFRGESYSIIELFDGLDDIISRTMTALAKLDLRN
ncbi:hypothetical protein AB9V60_13630 [Pseudomonas syringae pv. atrofaciens]|uniref:hypothetical protein n=1 Tax=Pseudomonas syringae TaxID=317 RepID=UPI00351E06AA